MTKKACPTYVVALLAWSVISQTGWATDADLQFFEKKIRPVLVEHCYSCHSAASAKDGKLRGGLFVDTREGIRKGGESGPGVVPGKPADSLVLAALKHETFEMPPKGKLPEAVIADFAKWIESGAIDPREGQVSTAKPRQIDIEAGRSFWAFQPLKKVSAKPIDGDDWSVTEIDRWIRAKQQDAKIAPNGTASPRILVRRLWFDVIGLPPTPEEVDHWTKRLVDANGKFNRAAWSELVDLLLDNPHYGERWARHWMDVARFAESHGYEQDYDRPSAYHYRDFLIRAFNEDLPYSDFVRWQIAGDEIAPENPEAWKATGFLGAGAFPTQLTEAEFESARYDELDDMVGTTGVAFLGLSLSCCRCHDHKFDPVPSFDYYNMAATFATAIRGEKVFDFEPAENEKRQQDYDRQTAQLQAELKTTEEALKSKLVEWSKSYQAPANPASWQTITGKVTSTSKTDYQSQLDNSYLATGKPAAKDTVTLVTSIPHRPVRSLRLEALTHPSLPQKGPGRAANGNFVLSQIVIKVRSKNQADWRIVPLTRAVATHEQNANGLSVKASLDAEVSTGWAVDGQIGKDQAAVFSSNDSWLEGMDSSGEVELLVQLSFENPNPSHTLGRFRLSLGESADLPPSVGGSEGPAINVLASIERMKQGQASADDVERVWNWQRQTNPEWLAANKRLADHRAKPADIRLTKVLVTSEGLPKMTHHADGRGFPHFYPEVHHLKRGDVHQKGDAARMGFLQVMMPANAKVDRWAVQPSSGDGSVQVASVGKSPFDKGPVSTPSYRRTALARWLVDPQQGAGHLAARVIVNRLWQHHFGRGIVATPNDLGASGERPTHPELLDWLASDLIDGGWRLKRVHKQMLTSSVYLQSGDFDEQRAAADRENTLYWRRGAQRLEGEIIRDAMLSVAGQLDTRIYGPSEKEINMKRRGVYFFVKRGALIPMMMLFDWPEHLVSIGQRAQTTIAPQALMFLNSPQGREYASAFAKKLESFDDDAAITAAYRLALSRVPTEVERATVRKYISDRGSDAQSRLNARTDFCQVLFSTNEFIYIE